MIPLTVTEAKGNFFDRLTVSARVDRARVRNLSRLGAFIRRRAQTSMRRRKGISKAGEPPSAHVGLVRDLTYFVYDTASESVVIGPVKLNKPGAALDVLEHGGDVLTTIKGKAVSQHYEARPFMGPALDAELPQAAPLWANTIRG
jgi:hypothetical protein